MQSQSKPEQGLIEGLGEGTGCIFIIIFQAGVVLQLKQMKMKITKI